MKHIHSIFLFAVCVGMAFCLGACRNAQSGVDLGGDCRIVYLTLDSLYEGTVDFDQRAVRVGVPEAYDVTAMTVTDLALSAGAKSNVHEGDVLNMTTDRCIRVLNGDAQMDWTLSVHRMMAQIVAFNLSGKYLGIIDQVAHTILVRVPKSENITSMVPNITLSAGAVVDPAGGRPTDFSHPVQYTVTNGSSQAVYTVTVELMESPHVLYVGLAPTMVDLGPEEKAACSWMLENIDRSTYASFASIREGTVDMSECRVIWWHFHYDGGIDNPQLFEEHATEAIRCLSKLQTWFSAGGSLLLTRYATYLPGYLEINGRAATKVFPNNCWGNPESEADVIDSPWYWNTEQIAHPLYADLIKETAQERIHTFDAGYSLTNTTAQWHIGTDWGGYPTRADVEAATGFVTLGQGNDQAIVAWEFPRSTNNGCILCIGSGIYDWYSPTMQFVGYHQNVLQMTRNAIQYLLNE